MIFGISSTSNAVRKCEIANILIVTFYIIALILRQNILLWIVYSG